MQIVLSVSVFSKILVKTLGTLLPTYGLSVPSLPPAQWWRWFIQSRPTIPTLLHKGGGELWKLNNDFPLQNNASPVGVLSSVPGNFGQDFNRRKLLRHWFQYTFAFSCHSWYLVGISGIFEDVHNRGICTHQLLKTWQAGRALAFERRSGLSRILKLSPIPGSCWQRRAYTRVSYSIGEFYWSTTKQK